MIDTISFHIGIEPPEDYYKQIPREIYFNGLKLFPQYRNNLVKGYSCSHRNLKISLTSNRGIPCLKITNSLHKYYNGNNYSDFSFSEVIDALFQLENELNIPFFNSKITRLDYGVNIELDAEKLYPNFLSYKNKSFHKMMDRGLVYGAKAMMSEVAIKGYNKTIETKRRSREKISSDIFRFEIEVKKMSHLTSRSNPIQIYTLRDLIDHQNFSLLGADILNKYDQIKKRVYIDLFELTLCEKNVYASMQIKEVKDAIKRDHPDSYKKYRSKEKHIYKNAEDSFYDVKVRDKLEQKINYLVNH